MRDEALFFVSDDSVNFCLWRKKMTTPNKLDMHIYLQVSNSTVVFIAWFYSYTPEGNIYCNVSFHRKY